MEPITSLATGYATDKLIEVAESAFKTHVFERWTRHRARKFFEAFCTSMADVGTSDEDLRHKLNELLSNETRSQIVWDAYRAVCLSKSRNLGPRIIAYLTAELVVSGAAAGEEDERIFAAAEELSDSELEQFSAFAEEQQRRARRPNRSDSTLQETGALLIQIADETTTSTWHSEERRSVAPLNLVEEFGTWALKLKRLGLLSDDINERQWHYDADDERHIDEPGVAREITWWLTLDRASLKLASLTSRASATSQA